MKKFFKVFLVSMILPYIALSQNAFAQESDSDEYIDEYYEDESSKTQNGKGDQFIAIRLMPLIPLNFDGQLYVGGGISIGFHKFLI